jgi:hypothetical protein
VKKNFLSYLFFGVINFKKLNYFIFEMLEKKIWANFQRILELFTQKIVSKLSKIWVWDPGSEIRDPEKTYYGSRGQKGTGSATLPARILKWPVWRHTKRTIICTWRSEERKWKMDEIPANIGKIIDNIGLLREANHLLDQMKIFGSSLDTLQGDSCHLSDAVHIWLSLLKNPELSTYRVAIKKRFEEAIGPFHILAYMTDHRYTEDWKS